MATTPSQDFMLIKSSNKKEAYTAVINELLKDNRAYCNYCGKSWDGTPNPGCEDPQVGTNADVLSAVITQNISIRDSRNNDYASTKNKSLRWGLSIPGFVYEALHHYEKSHNRKFLGSNDDINWFMKNFPQFSIPRRA